MMPTHIITVQDNYIKEQRKLEFTDNVSSTEDLITFIKDIYGDTLVAAHKISYQPILTQVF